MNNIITSYDIQCSARASISFNIGPGLDMSTCFGGFEPRIAAKSWIRRVRFNSARLYSLDCDIDKIELISDLQRLVLRTSEYLTVHIFGVDYTSRGVIRAPGKVDDAVVKSFFDLLDSLQTMSFTGRVALCVQGVMQNSVHEVVPPQVDPNAERHVGMRPELCAPYGQSCDSAKSVVYRELYGSPTGRLNPSEPEMQRLPSHYCGCGTETGRCSSTKPHRSNLPRSGHNSAQQAAASAKFIDLNWTEADAKAVQVGAQNTLCPEVNPELGGMRLGTLSVVGASSGGGRSMYRPGMVSKPEKPVFGADGTINGAEAEDDNSE